MLQARYSLLLNQYRTLQVSKKQPGTDGIRKLHVARALSKLPRRPLRIKKGWALSIPWRRSFPKCLGSYQQDEDDMIGPQNPQVTSEASLKQPGLLQCQSNRLK